MSPSYPAHVNPNALRILLVEDDLIHARLIQRAITERSKPGNVTHFTDGEPAIELLMSRDEQNRDSVEGYPDLVLLDLQLPGTSGFEVLRKVKAGRKSHHVPIVVISSSDLPEDITKSYELGANAYITKPGDFDLFVEYMAAMYTFWGQVVCLPHES